MTGISSWDNWLIQLAFLSIAIQYVHDLVDGLILLMNGDETRPVNIGNPDEFTILEFAEAVRSVVEEVQKESGTFTKQVNIVHREIPTDDPMRRRPDTTRAKKELQWQPNFTVLAGVREMVLYYQAKLKAGIIA